MEQSETYKIIEKHLNENGMVCVYQGSNKLGKTDTAINKFNWDKTDILKQASSIQDFIEQLPKHGFTNGTTLMLRKANGNNRFKTIGETKLMFTPEVLQKYATNAPMPAQQQTTHPMQHTPVPTPQPTMQQPQNHLAAPVINGMAYAQVPQHEVVKMMVQGERYAELLDKLKKSEDELATCKSDLRMEKESRHTAERKLESIEDRWQFKLDKSESDKKGFLDTDTGKELVTGLAGSLPQLIEAFKNRPQTQLGMGNPFANISAAKQQFFAEMQNIDDAFIAVLRNTATAIEQSDEFANHLVQQLEEVLMNIQQQNG